MTPTARRVSRTRSQPARNPTPLREIVRRVLPLPTASFAEGAVAAELRSFAAARGLDCTADRFGNLSITYRRGRVQRPLVLGAHMDHPGFIVQSVRGRTLQLEFRGGIGAEYGRGETLRLYRAARDATQDATQNRAGIATRSYASVSITSVRQKGGRLIGARATVEPTVPGRAAPVVAAGDLALWDVPGCRLRGNRVQARQCDDLAGVAGILSTIDRLWAARANAHVVGLFTRAEEVGLRGASAAARAQLLPPDALVVAVETSSHVGGRAEQGGGPIVRVGDAVHIFSPAMTRWMSETAAALQRSDRAFRFQRKLMDGGVTEATAYDLYGYETGAVCIALGNYHNAGPGGRVAAETVDLRDLDGMSRLFEQMALHTRDFPHALPTLRKRYDGLAREAQADLERTAAL